MLLKVPCRVGGQVQTLLINRDSISVVQPVENGESYIYVKGVQHPLQAVVRFKTLSGFLGSAFTEGVVPVPQEKENNETRK